MTPEILEPFTDGSLFPLSKHWRAVPFSCAVGEFRTTSNEIPVLEDREGFAPYNFWGSAGHWSGLIPRQGDTRGDNPHEPLLPR